MTTIGLYECFEEHLLDLEIIDETEEVFVTQVLENYLLKLSSQGYHFLKEGEDLYVELREEVSGMLKKKTYAYMSLNHYRESLRMGA